MACGSSSLTLLGMWAESSTVQAAAEQKPLSKELLFHLNLMRIAQLSWEWRQLPCAYLWELSL